MYRAQGSRDLVLRPGEGTAPSWHRDPVTGGSLHFLGDGGHLKIPAARAAALDFGAVDAVTVLALVCRDGPGTGFIAGLWQEDDEDPRRQYGLFMDLPTYGGGDQVAAHVSATGGPSPELPYSRDYAASARMVRPGAWRVIGMSYDGVEATAFLDGIADPRSDFIEVGPPLGGGLRAAKNPYAFPGGLNRGTRSDFTVGAVQLSSGIGNALRGRIAQLAIWNRALAPEEITACSVDWTPAGQPLARFDWWRSDPAPGLLAGGADGSDWPIATAGLRVAEGDESGLAVRSGRLVRAQATERAILLADTPGLRMGMLGALGLEAASHDQVEFAVVADGRHWFGSRLVGTTLLSLEEPRWHAVGDDRGGPLPLPATVPVEAVGLSLAAGPVVSLGEFTLWPA